MAHVKTSWGLVNGPDSLLTPDLLNQALGVEGGDWGSKEVAFLTRLPPFILMQEKVRESLV